MIAPVTNIAAGAAPNIAQVAFVVWSQSPGPLQGIPMPRIRPKCKKASQYRTWSTMRRLPCNRRLDSVGDVLDRCWKTEVDPAQGKYQRKAKAPEADGAVQVPVPAPPSHPPMRRQAAAPCLDPGHQIDRPVTASPSRANAPTPFTLRPDDPASRLSCRSISSVTSRKAIGRRSAKIVAAVRIEKPFLELIALAQPNIHRLFGIFRPVDAHHPDTLDTDV